MNITMTLNGKKISADIDADHAFDRFCAGSRMLQREARL